MSGAAVADAVGSASLRCAMDDAGYDHTFSAAITAASSTIAPVIPPSIPFVIFSSVTGVSVLAFRRRHHSRLLMSAAMCVVVYIISKRRKFRSPRCHGSFGWRFMAGDSSLFCVAIIIGGLDRIFTANEAAIVLRLRVDPGLAYKNQSKELGKIVYDSIISSCKTLFIIAVANFLAYFMLHQRIPNQVIEGLIAYQPSGRTHPPHDRRTSHLVVLEGVSVILITVQFSCLSSTQSVRIISSLRYNGIGFDDRTLDRPSA